MLKIHFNIYWVNAFILTPWVVQKTKNKLSYCFILAAAERHILELFYNLINEVYLNIL